MMYVPILLLYLSALVFSVSIDCPPCLPDSCIPVYCRHVYTDQCGCCPYCARNETDPCGGTINYWGSCKPGLKCVYRLGRVFNEERMGFCETDSCSAHSCGYRQYCTETHNKVTGGRELSCKCPFYNCTATGNATRSNETVCGNDGITYSSKNCLWKEECKRGSVIGIRHNGNCTSFADDQSIIDGGAYKRIIVTVTHKPDKCMYRDKIYLIGESIDNQDPCIILNCVRNGAVLATPVPGCGDNPPDLL
ncbi:PREDICTED: follistatin-like isoform X2 [Amphimedon queenslandica]|uniref:IGFBP N-terminal domain-containing protein n=1 Tax=Amphimedon queenslandica TaxID=400682 RepID=A0AAN0JLA3_AMPQE|nr:PREDICTED: follistatin-like isoform X2 [Amphimedon queenslandica]|eukprot:XP_019857505.1 PREDICTED: follistatin-like isoform X2 [Amphimedon queenslandica]